jgi:hypothetical protein
MGESLLSKSVRQFKTNWRKLSLNFFVIGLLSTLSGFSYQSSGSDAEQWMWIFFYIFVYAVAAFALRAFTTGLNISLFLGTTKDGVVPSLEDCFKLAAHRYKSLLMQSLLLGLVGLVAVLMIAVMTVVLILTSPDIFRLDFTLPVLAAILVAVIILVLVFSYFGIRLSLASFALMDSEMSAKNSIIRSWRLTARRVWYIVGKNLPIIGWGLVIVAGAMVALFASVFFWPLSLLAVPVFVVVLFVYSAIVQLFNANLYLNIKALADGGSAAVAIEQPPFVPLDQPETAVSE